MYGNNGLPYSHETARASMVGWERQFCGTTAKAGGFPGEKGRGRFPPGLFRPSTTLPTGR
jgi:hypothetical protein